MSGSRLIDRGGVQQSGSRRPCDGGAGGDRDRVGLLGHGGRMVVFGVSPAPAAISVSPFRVYNDKIVITGPMAILRSFGLAGRRL